MKPQWTPSYFQQITQYNPLQQQVIDTFLPSLEQNQRSRYRFYAFQWSAGMYFAGKHGFAFVGDQYHPLIEAADTCPSPGQPEYYLPLVHQQRMLIAHYSKATFLGYLLFNELSEWQVIFLSSPPLQLNLP